VKFDIAESDLPPDEPPPEVTCENIDEFPSSVGCEFYAIQTYGGFTGFGISVGNPWLDKDAHIVIEDMRGPNNTLRLITEFDLGPKESQISQINGGGGLLDGQNHRIQNGMNVVGAFRVTSDVPITAMQIDPIGGAPSMVPEASMLLPTSAAEPTYLGINYVPLSPSWVSVVAIEDGTTVTTTQGDVMLNAFDVFRYSEGGDMTGFFVTADQPVLAFSGVDCVNVPMGVVWCDHLEEQLIPLASWGTAYVGARHPPRLPEFNPEPELVYWRVIAAVDDQVVELEPAQQGVGDSIELATIGDFVEFSSAESFVATSEEPFMLVQYMAGGASVDPTNDCMGITLPTGDPYMAQTVPIEQWLTQLPFLTDASYQQDFVVISREAGTTVDLECLGEIPDDHFTEIPGTSYEVGFVELDIEGMGGEGECVDGQQFVTASDPVGVLVGGYDCAAGYGYNGGLSLDALWEPPDEPPE
jgi:hypothetical protein